MGCVPVIVESPAILRTFPAAADFEVEPDGTLSIYDSTNKARRVLLGQVPAARWQNAQKV